MYIDILGKNRFYLFIVVVVAHAVLFLYVILNFSISTFMDPGRFPKSNKRTQLSQALENLKTIIFL